LYAIGFIVNVKIKTPAASIIVNSSFKFFMVGGVQLGFPFSLTP
jgi:hypothetical protein